MQIWECVFKVITVDALIRLGGFVGKSMIMLVHPAIPEENNRRRSQVNFSLHIIAIINSLTVIAVRCITCLEGFNQFYAFQQVLSFLEQLLQMYRTVVTVPCWIMYYNSLGMGFFWTWCLHGALRQPFWTCLNAMCVIGS